MLIKPKDLVLPKAKSNLNNPSGYLPDYGASACPWDSHPGEENALIVLHMMLEWRGRVASWVRARGASCSQTDLALCTSWFLQGVRDKPASLCLLDQGPTSPSPVLCTLNCTLCTEHWPECQKEDHAPKALLSSRAISVTSRDHHLPGFL